LIHAGQHTVGSYFLYPFKWWKILHRARLNNIWKLFLALTRSCAVLVNQELILTFMVRKNKWIKKPKTGFEE
jgi:hypothetical protein